MPPGEETFLWLCKQPDLAVALRGFSVERLRELSKWLKTEASGEIKEEVACACAVEVMDRFTDDKL